MGTDTKPLALGLASVARNLDISRRTVHRLVVGDKVITNNKHSRCVIFSCF
jgi:plasmid maintenance system antidote protein VapI